MPLNCTPFKMVKWPILCLCLFDHKTLNTHLPSALLPVWVPCVEISSWGGAGFQGWGYGMVVDGLDRFLVDVGGYTDRFGTCVGHGTRR